MRITACTFVALLLVVGPLAGGRTGAQSSPSVLSDHLTTFADSLAEMPRQPVVVRGRTYVPVYSSVMVGGGRTRLDFSVTLSIHNTSQKTLLVIERVDYFDTAGKIIEQYLPRPIALKSYGTIQIVVAQHDIRGGLGANFVVDWSSPDDIDEPAIEAVMISTHGTQGYSFLSIGRRVARP